MEGHNGPANLLIRFTKIWENAIEMEWGKELYDGKENKKYHVHIQSENGSFTVDKYFLQHETSYSLHGLTPSVMYTVSLRAMHEGDKWGAWTTAAVTTQSPVKLSVGEVGADFIHGVFIWGGQLDTPTHRTIDASKFELRVKQKERVLDHGVFENFLAGTLREFKITDLRPNCTFLVQLRAISASGDQGVWSEETRFLTLNDVKVWMQQVGEDYSIIEWQRVESSDQLNAEHDTKIPEFTLVLELEPDQRERDIEGDVRPKRIEERSFGDAEHSHRFNNLRPGRAYRVQYRYRNLVGDWAKWREFRFLTLAPVAMVEVVAVSQDFIHVSWRREEQTMRSAGGAETIEQLEQTSSKEVSSWQLLANDCVTKETASMELPGWETSSKVVALQPNREYSVRVRAMTKFGEWGPWSTEKFVYTLPVLSVRVDARGENWILVSWDRKERMYPDNVTRYHVQLVGVDSAFRSSKYFEPNEISYRFSQLKPSSSYHLAVQACVGVRWGSWSENCAVSSCAPAVVKLSRRGEDFIHVKWVSDYIVWNAIDTSKARYQLRIFSHNDAKSLNDRMILDQELIEVNAFRLTKLPCQSVYGFQVRTYDIHSGQWGIWSQEVLFSTLKSSLTFTEVSETFFEVAWQRNPKIVSKVADQSGADDPLAIENVAKYMLRIQQVLPDGQMKEFSKFLFSRNDPMFRTVTDLTPNTPYVVQMQIADDRDTWSPWSAPAAVTTISPVRLEVQDIGEDYARFTWKRETPITKEANRVLMKEEETEYSLTLTRIDNGLLPGSSTDQVESSGPLLHYSVVGESSFVVRNLSPQSSYRVQIRACPVRTRVWGVWSNPVYIRTVEPVQVSLDLIGEEFAHVSWERKPFTFAGAEDMVIMTSESKKERSDAEYGSEVDAPLQGRKLYYGDPVVTEFHVRVVHVPDSVVHVLIAKLPPKELEHLGAKYAHLMGQRCNVEELEDADAVSIESKKTLQFEMYVSHSETRLRVPSLHPNTTYQVQVRSMNRWEEWGQWSNALYITTEMPTELQVVDITQDSVVVRWGRYGNIANSSVLQLEDTRSRFQLRIIGKDDDYKAEAELAAPAKEYCIAGLSINACYSVQIRAFSDDDRDWGLWSTPIYVATRSIPVKLLETSQDWMRVFWKNPQVKDRRQRRLFATLIWQGVSSTLVLPGDLVEHVFSQLKPSTHYSIHLLCIEQVPYAIPFGGGSQNRESEAVVREGHDKTVLSLPVIGADYKSIFSDCATFTTLPVIIVEVEKLGENFVALRWKRTHDSSQFHLPAGVIPESDADFEIEVTQENAMEVEVSEAEEQFDPTPPEPGPPEINIQTRGSKNRKVKGVYTLVTGLQCNATYSFRVRQISSLPSRWSEASIVQTLDKVHVAIGGPRALKMSDGRMGNPGIGEDFVQLNWEASVHTLPPHTTFELRVLNCDKHGNPLPTQPSKKIYQCSEPRYRVSGLLPDTVYRLNVRSVIPAINRDVVGEWSEDMICATLAPMAITVDCVAEEHARVRWKRRAMPSDESPVSFDTNSLQNVNRYNLRVLRLKSEIGGSGGSAGPHGRDDEFGDYRVVWETFYTEENPEFLACLAVVNVFQPNHTYFVHIRAATNNCWGTWSEFATLQTMPSLVLRLRMIGENTVFVDWARAEKNAPASANRKSTLDEESLAPFDSSGKVKFWEILISTVGKDRRVTVFTVPPEALRHCCSQLLSNSHYSAGVRAFYNTTEMYGPASNLLYFATLSPMVVQVGHIGETFVHVKWERTPQQRMTNTLRAQHRQQQADFDNNQVIIKQRISYLQQQLLSDDVFAAQLHEADPAGDDPMSLSQLMSGASPPPMSPTSPKAVIAPEAMQLMLEELRSLQKLMQEQQRKQRELIRLQQLQLQELEKETLYPSGNEMVYEVCVCSNPRGGSQQFDNEGQPLVPFSCYKRLPTTNKSCKMEGLFPHTTYMVAVRGMHSNGHDVEGYTIDPTAIHNTPPGAAARPPSARPEERGEGEPASDEDGVPLPEGSSDMLWGAWSDMMEFTTLKQVTLTIMSIGSSHVGVQWDTGYTPDESTSAQHTAIVRFQIRIVEKLRPDNVEKEVSLEAPGLRMYTVTGLKANRQYTITIRVCYEGEKWGMWSLASHFLTLHQMKAKMVTTTETSAELLVWRDKQTIEENGLHVWRAKQTTHKLSINGQPSPATFQLDYETSTLLTLTDLETDIVFKVQVREQDQNKEWRDWQELITFETLPFAPSKPVLEERKGTNVAITWTLKKNCPDANYVYCVEMALAKPRKKKKEGGAGKKKSAQDTELTTPASELEPFQVMGLLYEQVYRMELKTVPLPRCVFRVKVAKEHHTLEGPRHVDESINAPSITDVTQYLWSQYSLHGQFANPSLPGSPGNLKVASLKDTTATLKWNKPRNWKKHTKIIYKIWLGQAEQKLAQIAQTEELTYTLTGLLPNNHYKCSVMAESAMGLSQNNNTLRLSTKPSGEGRKGAPSPAPQGHQAGQAPSQNTDSPLPQRPLSSNTQGGGYTGVPRSQSADIFPSQSPSFLPAIPQKGTGVTTHAWGR